MLNLLTVSSDDKSFSALAAAFAKHDDVTLFQVLSGAAALKSITDKTYDLIIIDEILDDMAGLELAEKVIKINSMINCAAVSTLAQDEFHEASEGLGILAQLPKNPGAAQAEAILSRLREIINLMKGDLS
ncbi:response regulator [Desulfococcaceae bacterium HSG7]|nr:response regulator [Desulfococcaceae bacterium HSG7]